MTRFLAVLVLLGALTACTDDRDPPRPARAAAHCDPALDAAFGAWARAGFSGSVAISTGGRFDCLAGYGSANDATGAPNTADTVFSIGSVTKAVTAATVLELVEAGKLALDDPAGKLLPALTGPVAGVTVRQLLLHTSGLNGTHGDDHEPLDRAAALAAISGLELAVKPGSRSVYSNAGYTLLALIIDRVSGATYRDYTAARMLRLPDGRTAGGFWDGEPAAPGPRAAGYLDTGRTGRAAGFAGPHWALDGNGGLAMSVRDLADWTHALFTGRLVAPEPVRAIVAPGYDLGGGRSETPGWVAHDASLFGTPFLATAGGGDDIGHNAVVAWIPERRRVVVMASNKPEVPAEDLLRKMGPALLAGKPLPTPPAPATTGPTAATGPTAVTGKYKLDTGGTFDVTGSGDRIAVSAAGVDAVAALFPPCGDASAGDFRAHEERTLALLHGRTREGRAERAALEREFGAIRGIALAGTAFRDGDIRTYVTLTAGTAAVTGWYALNPEGGIEAAEVPTGPPALTLVAAGDGRYRPAGPAGAGVTAEFRNGRMTVSGPAGSAAARPVR